MVDIDHVSLGLCCGCGAHSVERGRPGRSERAGGPRSTEKAVSGLAFLSERSTATYDTRGGSETGDVKRLSRRAVSTTRAMLPHVRNSTYSKCELYWTKVK